MEDSKEKISKEDVDVKGYFANKWKNFRWQNLFKVNIISWIQMITIIFVLLAFNNIKTNCEEVMVAPCDFCDNSGCCEIKSDIVGKDGLFINNPEANEKLIKDVYG